MGEKSAKKKQYILDKARVVFSEKLVIPRLKIFEKIAPSNICI